MANDFLPKIEGVEGKTVFVGLSGGVDSAVSAAMLQASGAEVIGVFMKNWAGEQGLQIDCPWEEDMLSAQNVAEFLGIEFRSYNFEKEYKKYVLDYFLEEYEAGRTPNPDILCNSEIKFKAFLEKAMNEGADLIATGHYAGVGERELKIGKKKIKSKFLINAGDETKDQTYFLSALSQEQLSKAVFPLAKLAKSEVRVYAKELKLPNAEKKDSQGICFVGDLDVQAFLRKYISKKPGPIVDIDTDEKVGEHDGLAFYTIGQREGIRIGGVPEPYYVVRKHESTNTLYVAQGRDNKHLFFEKAKFSALHFINKELKKLSVEDLNSLELKASIRYRHEPVAGRITDNDLFRFTKPQRAVTPGQSLVFYSGDICLGRAVIEY